MYIMVVMSDPEVNLVYNNLIQFSSYVARIFVETYFETISKLVFNQLIAVLYN